MKKIVFVMSMVLIGLILQSDSCGDKSGSSKNDSSKPAFAHLAKSKIPIQISLNGFYPGDADNMVNAFENGRTGDDKDRTDIWISKGLVHQIRLLLHKENGDGARIYFARDVTNDSNDNIILISTRYGGKYLSSNGKDSITIHLDYFEHNAPFLTSIQAKDISLEHNPSGTGAKLYNPNSPCTPADTCSIVPKHDLKCDTAYNWVQNFSLSANDKTNTTSEFFDLDFIDKLDQELQKTQAPDGPDGLRIYFAKRTKDQRLVFVIVTTKTVGAIHEDYYNCFPIRQGLHAGDNGEQCPTNCSGTTWP